MIARYTQQLVAEFDRTGEARLEFGVTLSIARARARLANAARHAGLIIETHIERDSAAGFGPETGAVVATVVGWRDDDTDLGRQR